jgi:Ser/Thr protein kinase RdoA (MazF antagonist)
MTEADNSTHPYDALVPDVILDAVETFGFRCTGAILPLNSYENRVYRINIEDAPPLAAKFYRPERWSDDQILEEHHFTIELAAHEIPAVAPMPHNARTLHEHAGFRFALFPWQPGRTAELTTPDHYRLLGRYLGRLHKLGAAKRFEYRPALDVQTFGHDAVAFINSVEFLPPYLEQAWAALTERLLQEIERHFEAVGRVAPLRLHGDCHLSNILWTDTGPHIVDFDDCRSGPAVQDLWMLLTGDTPEREQQLAWLLDGYMQFRDFDVVELQLMEPLRTLRMLHYSAWLASRWSDPAFPRAFPWFEGARYWEDQILNLREQQALLQEAPLRWRPELAG